MGQRKAKHKRIDATPRVTIVVSFRERWRFTALTAESILRNTQGDFALWLLDTGIPEDIRAALDPHVQARELQLVEVRNGRQPNEWRGSVIAQLASPYAVFIDNDVVVRPGWLDHMLACAEETDAGIVCPLYLWGDNPETDAIHMAGGDLRLVPGPDGTCMSERHRHVGRRIAEVPEDLHRATCGFGEFHCLMMRREIYSAPRMFDAGVVTVHEHIHASMLAREMGYETWFEPAAQVTYLAFAPWKVGELAAARVRWNFTEADRSLENFARRWKVVDDADYRSSIHRFLLDHAAHTDLLDPRPQAAQRRGAVMTRPDLQQTLAGLQWLALDRGYLPREAALLVRAYRMAVGLTNGIYRPCGRPFINHLAGTASVLLFYGCAMPQVLAGLLHAVRTHGPPAQADEALSHFRTLSSITGAAVGLVHAYSQRAKLLDTLALTTETLDDLLVDLASLFVIDAANEVDRYLSLEIAMTGRRDAMPDARLANCELLFPRLGLPGLAATLAQVRSDAVPWRGSEFQQGLKTSVRLRGLAPPAAEPQQPMAVGNS